MYNTKAFSSKIALKNFRCPQWRRLFCSLRSVLSCCEKAFVNLSRMCVSSKFERDLCPEPCDNAVIRLSVLLSYLICKMLQETLTLISHSAIDSFIGVNELISTSSTRCWYLRFFSSSCSLNNSDVVLFW